MPFITLNSPPNKSCQARMVETLQTRGVDGMGDALFGTLTGYLDPAENAKVDDAIAAVLARLA